MNEKNCLFQYATRSKIIEDTELVTMDEAVALWNKYLPHVRESWDAFDSPQMCIWIECSSNTSYHTVGREIDFRDCVLENGSFYRVTKDKIA